MRKLHRWPALIAAVFLIVLAISGTMLSVFPALEKATMPSSKQGQSVAELAMLAMAAHPSVEQIRRASSGKITVWWFEGNTPTSAVFDPATGQDMGSADPNTVEQWLTNFHRALFLDDTGRIVTAIAAAAMLILALSGLVLITRRVGGWRHWFAPQKGPFAARFHTEIARLAVPILILSAITALWMTAANFDLLPNDEANPAFPQTVSGQTGFAPARIATFLAAPVTDLRDLTFPADSADVYTLTTGAGMSFIDQGTGAELSFAAHGPWARVYGWIYLLHTGQGAALWGLILGLIMLSVPVLAVTGTLSWAKGRGHGFRGVTPANAAQIVILVGSEGGTTWGFAATLARALVAVGQSVHVAALSSFAPERYKMAQQIVVMSATWGDGTAPTSAKGALEKLSTPTVPMTILGFGDSSFAHFCAYATAFDQQARVKGWTMLMPMGQINRQSPQDFNRWGREFGQVMGLDLDLNHQPSLPQVLPLALTIRRDYGEAVQAPAAILRFAIPQVGLWQRIIGRGFGSFQAGDLLGILPQGATTPRYYSLASGSKDGFLEIAIRKYPGGLCSGQLIAMQQGDIARGFLRRNPDFHPDHRAAPLILIGAGTGIGPLAGFIRQNRAKRPIHLWFGARHPDSDLFYGPELADWTKAGRLTALHTAFSRHGRKVYVQDLLRENADTLRELMAAGAKIMVCGGREMASGVRDALGDVLAPLNASDLKVQGRYVEDVY